MRYALGNTDRRVSITVNGNIVKSSLNFPSTCIAPCTSNHEPSWSNWKTLTINVPLNTGINTLKVTTTGNDGPNIDYLAIPIDFSLTPSPTVTGSPSCLYKEQGDANCDDKISGIDYSLWLNSQCRPSSTQSCADTKADFNNDSNIDDEDYTIWFKNSRT